LACAQGPETPYARWWELFRTRHGHGSDKPGAATDSPDSPDNQVVSVGCAARALVQAPAFFFPKLQLKRKERHLANLGDRTVQLSFCNPLALDREAKQRPHVTRP